MKIKLFVALIALAYIALIAKSVFGAPYQYKSHTKPTTKAGIVYYGSRGQIYYREPVQTPRWYPGYDVKIRTQTVTPYGGGSIILNRTYSK